MVTLPKPVSPLFPVRMKDTVVVRADWFVAILALDICELVMFPLISRSTVTPLLVVAGTVVVVGEGTGVGARVAVAVGESAGDAVEAGVGFGAKVAEIVFSV